ncbi:agouti-related protein [Tachyglossus aculeatus]|uniref:agouti-related protein n=1 Tax=Tachyglossus aculeatus TaxID=9261 RepID=UPI0018F7C724|nr:agouti-related protein [Tachyglossus aculeatus]
MLNTLLLSWVMLQGLQTIQTIEPGQEHLDSIRRASYSGLLRTVPVAPPRLPDAVLRPELERMAAELANEELMQEGGILTPGALDLQGREERSPRRCVRLLESCLGHQLPCCDPCATCYCRFFNAFCYCRKISATYPCSRN